jgi:hypothetical protein
MSGQRTTEAIQVASLQEQLAAAIKRLDTLEKASGLYATDKELDSQYGDPVLRFTPRDWKGDNYDGKRYSECPAALLDILAEYLAWSAANPKPEKLKYVPYNLKDAARARGWSRRKRSGWRPSATAAFDDDGVVPFDAPNSTASSTDVDLPF